MQSSSGLVICTLVTGCGPQKWCEIPVASRVYVATLAMYMYLLRVRGSIDLVVTQQAGALRTANYALVSSMLASDRQNRLQPCPCM